MSINSGNCKFTTKPKGVSTALPQKTERTSTRVPHIGRSKRPIAQLIMLGCCTAGFMLLFVFKILGGTSVPDVIAAMRELTNTGNEQEEQGEAEEAPGRLKLVQLPSIIEVFSPSDSPIMPLSFDRAIVEETSLIAKLYAPSGTKVVSMLAGTVKSISADEELGGCVVIQSEGDIEIYYYGLNDIAVEEGQPVLQHSTLGSVTNDIICIRIFERGRPIDPLNFLGIAAEIS